MKRYNVENRLYVLHCNPVVKIIQYDDAEIQYTSGILFYPSDAS